MNNINSYKSLLEEEERLANQIELSKRLLEVNIKSYLEPQNLFSFFERKISREISSETNEEFDLKEYLIGLSLDFLYEKVTVSLTSDPNVKKRGLDLKKLAKTYVDRFYVNNREKFTHLVSEFIDKKIEKWTQN